MPERKTSFRENWDNTIGKAEVFDHQRLEDEPRYLFQVTLEAERCPGLTSAKEMLSDYDCLTTPPDDYLHITIGDAGSPNGSGFDQEGITEAVEDLSKLLGTEGLNVFFGPLNRFENAVFAEVEETNGNFDIIHNLLTDDYDIVQKRFEEFLPHVTLAHLTCEDINELDYFLEGHRKLTEQQEKPLGEYRAEKFQLVRYPEGFTYEKQEIASFPL